MNGIFQAFAVFLALTFSSYGCESQDSSLLDPIQGEWLIPKNEIYDGGPGKDGIPALLNPRFIAASEASYVGDDDLVIGVKIGDEIRAYPHPILDWHEIINDDLGGTLLAITYCPLTGSGIAWNRVLGNRTTTFGVSGLLYNSNLLPYDRATNSNWSQMRLQCVNGELTRTIPAVHPVVETTWRTWRGMYPASQVVSSQTGYARPYGSYPYGDYKTSSSLIFPVSQNDARLPRKERVLGILVGNVTKVYRMGSFSEALTVVHDSLDGLDIVVAGSTAQNLAIAFERRLADGTILSFTPILNNLPVAMLDQEGTKWDIWGKAVEGPRTGLDLKPVRSYISYWFAWAAFYPGAEIHAN